MHKQYQISFSFLFKSDFVLRGVMILLFPAHQLWLCDPREVTYPLWVYFVSVVKLYFKALRQMTE